jgi:hypothetical protein
MITVLVAAVVIVVVVEEMSSLNPFLHPSQECSVKNVPCIDFMGTFLRMFGRQCTGISVKRRVASCSAQVTPDRLQSHYAVLCFFYSIIYEILIMSLSNLLFSQRIIPPLCITIIITLLIYHHSQHHSTYHYFYLPISYHPYHHHHHHHHHHHPLPLSFSHHHHSHYPSHPSPSTTSSP